MSRRVAESSVDDTEDDRAAAKRRQRNVRFKDSATSKTAHELKDFRAALERENLLQTIKNKVSRINKYLQLGAEALHRSDRTYNALPELDFPLQAS